MKLIITLILLSFSSISVAGVCTNQGKSIKIGETIYIQDPVLIQDIVNHGKKNNKTELEIKKYLATADWVGYVLRCTETFTINTELKTNTPADILISNGTALVLVEHQQEWVKNLKLSANEVED